MRITKSLSKRLKPAKPTKHLFIFRFLLEPLRKSPLLEGIEKGEPCYFVHSYAAPITHDCLAAATHGARFAALVQRGNIAGAQFHPERSGRTGEKLLENFVRKGCA